VNRRRITLAAAVLALLAACGDKTEVPAAAATKPSAREAYELAARANGFTVGPPMAANTVYVFFDPACPHCATLWGNARPLAGKLKMVWIPVGWLQRSSQPQAATILSAPDPVAAMAQNEALVLQRQGGITVSPSLGDDALRRIEANTDLFKRIGEQSVPLIVFRNGKTGEYGALAGAVSTEQLAAMAGV
jgi:thiol:disulfide interchange protein DsbG